VYPGGRQDEEIRLLERTTSPEWFAQEIGAEFTAFVGRIYNEFDEQIHVTSVNYNPNLPSYACFDFGWTNPFVCLEFQVDTWDNIYVWREHYKSHTTVPDHIDILNAREQPPNYQRPQLGFGDAADPGAVKSLNEASLGYTVYADGKAKAWEPGVYEVKKLLNPENPKLFISRECEKTLWEMQNYRLKMPRGTVDPSELQNEVPLQMYDHSLDALRYFVMHMFKLGFGGMKLEELFGTMLAERVGKGEFVGSAYDRVF
jgi:hypothetical protein